MNEIKSDFEKTNLAWGIFFDKVIKIDIFLI
jgi:hypothetical protein